MDIDELSPTDLIVGAWLKRKQVLFERLTPGMFTLPNYDLMLRIVQQITLLDRRIRLVRIRERDIATRLDQTMALALQGEEMPGG